MEGKCGDDTKLLKKSRSRATTDTITSEFLTSMEDLEPSAPSISSVFISTRIQQIIEGRSKFTSELDSEIEASKDHWSQVETTSDLSEDPQSTNMEIFKSLQETWPGGFFFDFGDRLKVGKKIAEGGQAEIFEAHVEYPDGNKVEYALKVFKEGYSLQALQKQWPQGLLQRKGYFLYDGTLLKNGRFAFRMQKCWGDLRRLIDMRMQRNGNQRVPFTDEEIECITFDIVRAMRDLHECNIVHRDLKGSNVLLHPFWETEDLKKFDPMVHKFHCDISDYECSVGVTGTGFWRAPEILLAQRNREVKPHMFNEKTDVFSFGMTLYEVLTGCVPFEDVGRCDYDHVLRGERPRVPSTVKPAHRELLRRCWCHDAAERPSFQEIFDCITSPNTEHSPHAKRFLNAKRKYGMG